MANVLGMETRFIDVEVQNLKTGDVLHPTDQKVVSVTRRGLGIPSGKAYVVTEKKGRQRGAFWGKTTKIAVSSRDLDKASK